MKKSIEKNIKRLGNKMKSHDLISVIIPVYNTYHYFEKCIKSVINQTYSNLEIIIINDDSTDKVEDIILKYKNIDRRIQYLKNLKNLGVGRTRNIGLEVAKGQYIYFLDSDDYIEENCIEEMYKAIKEDDSFSCITMGYKEMDTKKVSVKRTQEELNLLQSPSVCIRLFNKKVIDNSKVKFSDLKIGEDLEFIFKILIFNNNVTYIDKALFTYVIHNNSSIHTFNSNQLDTIKAMESVEDYARKKNKYNEFYEVLEFASVSHILIGTINRIVKIKDYKQKDIDRCVMWINNKYPNWKENRYVKKLILSNSKMLNYFEKYKLIK